MRARIVSQPFFYGWYVEYWYPTALTLGVSQSSRIYYDDSFWSL